MAKKNRFAKLLRIYLDRNEYMQQRYRKAAKRKRIRKKWLARFGAGFTGYLLDALNSSEPPTLFQLMKNSSDDWKGGTFQIPFASSPTPDQDHQPRGT